MLPGGVLLSQGASCLEFPPEISFLDYSSCWLARNPILFFKDFEH
jgi:hypothetical protein